MIALTLALAPRVMQDSPVGRLKKRLLAACRKRFDSGFESLLCPFLYRLSFDLVPDRSFPDLTISGVKKIITLAQLLVVQVQMTLSLYWWRQGCIFLTGGGAALHQSWERKQAMYICLEAVLFDLNYYFSSIVSRCMLSVTHHPIW